MYLVFSEFHQSDNLSRVSCENIENNMIKLKKHGKIHFKNRIAIYPTCKSYNAVKNGACKCKHIFF